MENRLKELRKEKGMTQEELSEKAGVSRTSISFLENGKETENTTTGTLIKLAGVFGLKVSDVFLC